MNKLMPFQVKRLFELAESEASSRKLIPSTEVMEETIATGRLQKLPHLQWPMQKV